MKNKEIMKFEMPDTAANIKFLSALLALYIWQTNPVFGYQYNKTTGIANKMYTIIRIETRIKSQVT